MNRPAAVVADPPGHPGLARRASKLAQTLHLPWLPHRNAPTSAEAVLVVRHDALAFNQPGEPRRRDVVIDWLKLRTASPSRPLVRAMGPARRRDAPRVVDACAGFGEDAWLLASMGWRVDAIERSATVAALAGDAHRRAATRKPDLARRIRLRHAESRRFLHALAGQPREVRPDVVYLDPMFPPKRGDAAPRRPLRLLRRLVGDDPDSSGLLVAACAAATQRVVVKRPRHAPSLGADVVATHLGRGVRYEVYRPTDPA